MAMHFYATGEKMVTDVIKVEVGRSPLRPKLVMELKQYPALVPVSRKDALRYIEKSGVGLYPVLRYNSEWGETEAWERLPYALVLEFFSPDDDVFREILRREGLPMPDQEELVAPNSEDEPTSLDCDHREI